MLRKYLYGLAVFVLAFVILSVSVFESSSISYAFTSSPVPTAKPTNNIPEIDYTFVYPGKTRPDSPFWSLKALRDKLLYTFTTNPLKKAELALLFSDKRLQDSKTLLEDKKPDLAISTLGKGEKYLELAVSEEGIARSKGIDTKDFLIKLASASLKHRQIIESLFSLLPEDGKPTVNKTEDYSKNSYNSSRDALNSLGVVAPKNPFDGNK